MKKIRVQIDRKLEKALRRLPQYLADKLDAWIESVETDGINEVRKVPGFHDEPLKGTRKGQRSIRLSRGYRVIYFVTEKMEYTLVTLQEVHKHDY